MPGIRPGRRVVVGARRRLQGEAAVAHQLQVVAAVVRALLLRRQGQVAPFDPLPDAVANRVEGLGDGLPGAQAPVEALGEDRRLGVQDRPLGGDDRRHAGLAYQRPCHLLAPAGVEHDQSHGATPERRDQPGGRHLLFAAERAFQHHALRGAVAAQVEHLVAGVARGEGVAQGFEGGRGEADDRPGRAAAGDRVPGSECPAEPLPLTPDVEGRGPGGFGALRTGHRRGEEGEHPQVPPRPR